MNEVEIFNQTVKGLDDRYIGKTIVAFFTYKEYSVMVGDVETLECAQIRWKEEGVESLLEICLSDGNSSRLTPIDSRPIKSVNYVIGEKKYIVDLENKWNGGGIIASYELQ